MDYSRGFEFDILVDSWIFFKDVLTNLLISFSSGGFRLTAGLWSTRKLVGVVVSLVADPTYRWKNGQTYPGQASVLLVISTPLG